MHIGRQEHVHRLALADVRRAVGGVLDHPALVQLERGLVDRLLLLGQEIEVLHAALVQRDRGPDLVSVAGPSRPAASAGAGCAR